LIVTSADYAPPQTAQPLARIALQQPRRSRAGVVHDGTRKAIDQVPAPT
jgi:hypothetical protein